MADDATIAIELVRRWVGSTPDNDAIAERLDSGQSVERVALAILETRRADLIAGGPSFSISGHYSQGSSAEFVKSLDDSISQLKAIIGGNRSGIGMARLARSDLRR